LTKSYYFTFLAESVGTAGEQYLKGERFRYRY